MLSKQQGGVMERLCFLVQGSEPEPYEVTFQRRDGSQITAICTCQAGQSGLYCKHRINLMDGVLTGITSGNESDLGMLVAWLPGSNLAGCLAEIDNAEKQRQMADGLLKKAKKKLADAMYGRPI
jgi:uncharacterized Zn finger protein